MALDETGHGVNLFWTTALIAIVFYRHKPQAGGADATCVNQVLPGQFRPWNQALFVEDLRGKLADGGMEAIGFAKKQAEVLRDGFVPAKDVIKRRDLGPLGVTCLLLLLQISRVVPSSARNANASNPETPRVETLLLDLWSEFNRFLPIPWTCAAGDMGCRPPQVRFA